MLPAAPALGWAVHSALALPLYRLIGFTPLGVALGSLVFPGRRRLSLRLRSSDAINDEADIRIPAWGFALAALLAVVPVVWRCFRNSPATR